MSYDDWKTTPPDDPPPTKCTCVFDEYGDIYEPCDFCQAQAKEDARQAALDAYWDQKIDEARER